MNNKLYFIFGLGIGVLIGIGTTKGYYAQIAQEEIDDVKKVYSKRAKEEPKVDSSENNSTVSENKNIVSEYLRQLKENGYAGEEPYRNISDVYDPYVITPEEFGEKEEEGYSTVNMTYYADGTLTDDMNHPMSEKDIEDIIGKANLERFGEYEEDGLHVRNDRTKCDYEILADSRTFEEVLDSTPYLRKEIEEES